MPFRAISKNATEDITYSTGVTHFDTLQEVINHVWSAGASGQATDFIITENGDGTINITGGDAILRSVEDPDGELKAYKLAGVTGMTFVNEATNYILADYNSGSPILTSSADLNDVVNVITKTMIYAVNRLGNDLNIIDIRAFNIDAIRKNAIKDYKVHGFEHASGAYITDLGTRNFLISASEFYLLNQPIQSAALDTSTTGTFEYVYQDGVGGWNRAASQTQIDNLHYDDGSGTLAVVGTNKYFCHYVYLVLNNPSHYKVVYGRELHNQLAAAQAEQVPSTLPSDLDSLSTGVFIGKIIVLQGVDAFEDIQSPFTQALTSSAATNHNNLAGLQGGEVGDYQHLTTAEVALVNGAIQSNEKGAVNGVATLGAGGKIPAAQLPSSVMEYLGNWDASTNTPTLADGTGDSGDVYRVNVSGTQDLGSGSQTFAVGDWVIYNGTIWERSDNADAVSSVNSQVGTVVLDADDIDDSTTAHKFATAGELSKLAGIEAGAEVNNISDANATDLTDGGDSTLHYHATDRARANHTGTQTASTISDFDTEVSNNTDVAANTTHRTSDGSDHTFINQSVTTSASPTFAGLTSSGAIAVDDTTNATSTTTGSLQTDGGLGVARKAYFGGGIDIETSSFPSFKTSATTTDDTGAATVFICKRKTSADMADGFGSNVQFRIEDDTSGERIIAKFTATRTGGADNRGRLRIQAGTNANSTYIDCNNNNSGVLDLPQAVTMGNDCTISGDTFLGGVKSGATQVAAGAAVDEVWKTSGHATLPDNVLMIGV